MKFIRFQAIVENHPELRKKLDIKLDGRWDELITNGLVVYIDATTILTIEESAGNRSTIEITFGQIDKPKRITVDAKIEDVVKQVNATLENKLIAFP
jgi:hypothetical protein